MARLGNSVIFDERAGEVKLRAGCARQIAAGEALASETKPWVLATLALNDLGIGTVAGGNISQHILTVRRRGTLPPAVTAVKSAVREIVGARGFSPGTAGLPTVPKSLQ